MSSCPSAPAAARVLAAPAPRPRLLDLLRAAAQQQGHANVAIDTYARWVVRYVRFHGCRHPSALGAADIGRFLDSVARADTAALRAIEEARNSLDFLYRQVLHQDLGELPRPRPPRLLDQVRQIMRVRHYSLRTEECYVQWITRFIVFHGKRHPRDLASDGMLSRPRWRCRKHGTQRQPLCGRADT